MTDTEKAEFGEMQSILKDSDTSDHGPETIPGLYRDVLRKANQEFQETKYRVKQYEAFNP